MKIGRALKVRDQAIRTVRGIYDHVASCTLTQKQELEMLNDVRSFLGSVKAPRWVVSYVEGFRDCLHGRVMAENVEFLYEINGHLVSTTKGHELDMRQHGITHEMIVKQNAHGGFYWIKNHQPYFLGERL